MIKPTIEIKALFKRFSSASHGYHQALADISLAIEPKEIYGIIGMSGAGKSTLMRCLIGLEKPSSGQILFQGQDIVNFSSKELRAYRKKIGMVFQNFNLFPARTVAENIAFAMDIHGKDIQTQEKRVTELLDLVHLSHKRHEYPARLSGGEKQRVGIARALANGPQVLFCDEATSALDPKTMSSLLNLLQELNERLGITIVAITHQLEFVKQICSKVAVLSKGRLVEEGITADLFSQPKDKMTRELLHGQLLNLPSVITKEGTIQELFRLSFKGDSVKAPIISRLLRLFAVEVNILQANIDSFQKAVFGELVIEFIGCDDERAKALQYLKENHIHWERL